MIEIKSSSIFDNFRHNTLKIGKQIMDLSEPKIMGILNITPDSFYDGGKHNLPLFALKHAEKLLNEGADIIDIGAYSTRSGAAEVSEDEELKRILPIITEISKNFPDAILSIDTFRSKVAEESIEHGTHIINDISGGDLDEYMFETIARLQVPYILMHTRGTPQNMQSQTEYSDITQEVFLDLSQKAAKLKNMGVKDIILDPGFGFAKTVEQSHQLLHEVDTLHALGYPILGGISRKSMIYKKLKITPSESLNGTTILNTLLISKGVQILRVHDVLEAKQIVDLISPHFHSACPQ